MVAKRRMRTYGLVAVTSLLLVVAPAMRVRACELETPNGAVNGVLLDAATGEPVQDVFVVVDTQRWEDPSRLDSWVTEDSVPGGYAGGAQTDSDGKFQSGLYIVSPLERAYTNNFTCCVVPSPNVTGVLDAAWVYVKVDGQWRELEVPLGAENHGAVVDGVRQFSLPTIYVTEDGLSLTPNA